VASRETATANMVARGANHLAATTVSQARCVYWWGRIRITGTGPLSRRPRMRHSISGFSVVFSVVTNDSGSRIIRCRSLWRLPGCATRSERPAKNGSDQTIWHYDLRVTAISTARSDRPESSAVIARCGYRTLCCTDQTSGGLSRCQCTIDQSSNTLCRDTMRIDIAGIHEIRYIEHCAC